MPGQGGGLGVQGACPRAPCRSGWVCEGPGGRGQAVSPVVPPQPGGPGEGPRRARLVPGALGHLPAAPRALRGLSLPAEGARPWVGTPPDTPLRGQLDVVRDPACPQRHAGTPVGQTSSPSFPPRGWLAPREGGRCPCGPTPRGRAELCPGAAGPAPGAASHEGASWRRGSRSPAPSAKAAGRPQADGLAGSPAPLGICAPSYAGRRRPALFI